MGAAGSPHQAHKLGFGASAADIRPRVETLPEHGSPLLLRNKRQGNLGQDSQVPICVRNADLGAESCLSTYIRTRNLWLDLKCILKTVTLVFTHEGAR